MSTVSQNDPAETPNPRGRISIAAYRTNAEGGAQIQIARLDAQGHGVGYRLAGPKHYNLGTRTLVERDLDEQDIAEIRSLLDAVSPPTLYELRHGMTDDSELVAIYTNKVAALRHGDHGHQLKFGIADDLTWHLESPAEDSPLRLYATDVDGEETETDWHIVSVTIPATYVPEGGAL
jgi:hypothetical protein